MTMFRITEETVEVHDRLCLGKSAKQVLDGVPGDMDSYYHLTQHVTLPRASCTTAVITV